MVTSVIISAFYCGPVNTVIVSVQVTKHDFKLFFVSAKILRELFKVQHSILVGVPSLHHLKTDRARADNDEQKPGWSGTENMSLMLFSSRMLVQQLLYRLESESSSVISCHVRELMGFSFLLVEGQKYIFQPADDMDLLTPTLEDKRVPSICCRAPQLWNDMADKLRLDLSASSLKSLLHTQFHWEAFLLRCLHFSINSFLFKYTVLYSCHCIARLHLNVLITFFIFSVIMVLIIHC